MRISDWSSDVCSSDLCANDACRPGMAASSARASASCRATAAVSSPVDWLEVPALDITRSCVLWGRYQGRVTTGCRQCERVRRQNAPMALDQILFLRSEEHTSELQSLMRISYAVFCLKKKTKKP